MNTDWLQSICAVVLVGGIVFAALGGIGTYYFGLKSAREKLEREVAHEDQLRARVTFLAQTNERLNNPLPPIAELIQDQPSELKAPAPAPAPEPATARITASAPATPAVKPLATTVKVSAPPLAVSIQTSTTALAESVPLAGRMLNENQRQQIVNILRKHPGKMITICACDTDPEGLAFANKLKGTFVEAGWKVDGIKTIPAAKTSAGLSVAAGTFPSPEGLVATYQALTKAGYSVNQQLDSRLAGAQAELIVGSAQ
jgi:hypothetical protein